MGTHKNKVDDVRIELKNLGMKEKDQKMIVWVLLVFPRLSTFQLTFRRENA